MGKYNVAIAGATGVVGQKMIEVLEESNIAVDNFYPMASSRSAGKKVEFRGKEYTVEELNEHSFDKDIDFALFSAGGGTSKKFAPIAAKNNVVVIDNSSQWRMDEEVPLVVPEVNPKDALKTKGIIANPNCSTIQAMVVLKPLHDAYKIKRVIYSTYQAVAGSGIKGIKDLEEGVKGGKNEFYPVQIAYNCLPHIDDFTENGYTKEELKMVNETHKILGDYDIKVTATTVRVPVFVGHSESINLEFEKPFDVDEARELLKNAPGVIVKDDISVLEYPTVLDAAGNDEVYVGRIRRDFSVESGMNLWCVGDNIRKGAASNTVQIAEYLIKENFFGKEN
ncbi:aspartate-semialdehyde dehydrogenase [Anaerofustis stercorihominis]|uniref:aspartate-semialdehyde dehydrogenase n=1 Tax=Anaerofustis stercorihominis TaxID=214853 RepID=UPI00214C08E9|nr:aspartate-semialdehyde dehydrogenase [Anaerofustis stercorihominis]MCR2033060.1 aspartate-semialdehyde dehydrogenase [Anaerofustis stercorihominis]